LNTNKILFYAAALLSVFCILASISGVQGASLTQVGTIPEIDQVIWDAIRQEAASRPEDFLFNTYDWKLSEVTYSDDEMWGVAWLDPLDPLTGEILATEPLVVIAELTPGKPANESSSWIVTFKDDPDWDDQASHVADLLPEELKMPATDEQKAPGSVATFGGYKLPWAAGVTKPLIWSAEHTSCTPKRDCVYAFDFADGTMFPLLAAKGGTVFSARDSCPNGSTGCTNSLIIKDVSTNPTSYQVYYHLAYNTIPAALHQVGAPVSQGQYIGNVDDTGYSSGHHLHFMVHTNPSGYWGTAVDITFKDVSINWDSATQGGRPRTKAGTYVLGGEWKTNYTSGNYGGNPPTGRLTLPDDRQTITSRIFTTAGSGSDNLGVTRLQLLAYFEGAWHEVGVAQTANPFRYDLDVCSANIPIGPFDLALRVWDVEGNQTAQPQGIRHLVNAVGCPNQSDMVCIPDADQVAIYSDINFSGSCRLLGKGTHDVDQLLPASSNDTASVILGNNVQLRLYDGELNNGRRETLINSDRNLSDNPIGNDRLSSASIQNIEYNYPVIVLDGTDPHGPGSTGPTAIDSITMTWWADGATKYQARIFNGQLSEANGCNGSSALVIRSPIWYISPTWSLGTLPAGSYTWCVRGQIADRHGNIFYSDWVMKKFDVTPASLPVPATKSLPYSYDVESVSSDWTGSGLWRRIADPWNTGNDLWACNNADNDYGDSTYGGGDLTSPPIQIPAAGATLHFKYRYETESDQGFWDRRWVQISKNGSRFVNLVQLQDDAMNTWLTSPVIDLSAYANSVVRIRFHFSTADKYYNEDMEGWLVDDIKIMTPTLQGCEESSNDGFATATAIKIGEALTAKICPAGDIDYFKFSAKAGDKLIASVDAMRLVPVSLLDTHLTLLDQDRYGNSPIASSNDLQFGVMTDSRLYFIIPETGNYYLKVKAGDHPSSGGSKYFYNLTLSKQPVKTDIIAPSLSMVYPTTHDVVAGAMTSFSALSEDAGSGVNRVEFWWHSPDWISGRWQMLTSDGYAGDGWNAPFDGRAYAVGQSGALVVISYDNEGNASLSTLWNLVIDNTPPVTNLNSLPATTDGTGIRLTWNASDAHNRLAAYDIQYQVDGGNWQMLQSNIPASKRSIWFIGQPGHRYGFRMHGQNLPGSWETYPDIAEVTTQTAATCKVDKYDEGKGDSKASSPAPIQLGTYQLHNYCGVGDIDWMSFTAKAGQEFVITVLPGSGSPAGGFLDLYQSNDAGWLLHREALGTAGPLTIRWVAPADGLYLIRLKPKVNGVSGNNATYRIRVGIGWWINFPIILR
jgi:hypothetical protein